VLARHLRRAGVHPQRWVWILRRIAEIVREGRLAAVLERHAIVAELYADYAAWLAQFDQAGEPRTGALRERVERLEHRPLVSVLLPTFESAPAELEAAVESVRRQVYPHWELCIVDDGSRSEELHVVLARLAMEDRVRVSLQSTNQGIARTLNAALAMAKGEFVAFLDHDDVLHEAALLRVVEAVNAHPDAKLLYTDEDLLDEHGVRTQPHFKPDWNEEWMRTSNYVLHLCVAATGAAREIGGFRSGLDGVQDWDVV
jgi:hypothetical protein